MRLARYLTALVALITGLSAEPTSAQQGISNYTLNTGDRIAVEVFGEPDLSIEAVVDDSGAISYPLLGAVMVTGQTARQLESTLVPGSCVSVLLPLSVTK